MTMQAHDFFVCRLPVSLHVSDICYVGTHHICAAAADVVAVMHLLIFLST